MINSTKGIFGISRAALLAVVCVTVMFSYPTYGSDDGGRAGKKKVPAINPGHLIVYNGCWPPLTIMVPPNKTIKTFSLGPGKSIQFTLAEVGTNMGFKPAPNLNAGNCKAVHCEKWSSVLNAHQCRQASQWENSNESFATYCNPTLAAAGTCDTQNNCCGPKMVQDYGFGTFFEISIQSPNDTPDISTNSNCPCGSGTSECLEKQPIFYNVPMKWTTNQECTMGTAKKIIQGAQCNSVTCPDAFTYPTDDKQVSCKHSETRGYLLEYCPAEGNDLPPF